ncbi:MAG: TonB-dependent receptor [bacterium]
MISAAKHAAATLLLTATVLIAQARGSDSDSTEVYHEVDSIVVSSARTAVRFHDLTRQVSIVSNVLLSPPALGPCQLLEQVPGIDLRQRGYGGAQADVSLRGATFEQTLVMIDGIKVHDPQTAHHALDLPLALGEVSRVEVLKGPGARLFGPNAMGGAINFITSPCGRSRYVLEATVGEYGLMQQSILMAANHGAFYHRFSLARIQSDGYVNGMELDNRTVAYHGSLRTKRGLIRLSARLIDKEFGAYRFYSDQFEDQWEATLSGLVAATAELQIAALTIMPKIHWRRHEDKFVLDRNRPEWYRNQHTSDQYGGELQVSFSSSLGITSVGGEACREELVSSNLGDHYRWRGGCFIEQQWRPHEGVTLTAGINTYRYTDYDWQSWPGLDFGLQLSRATQLYASAGRAFRVPTYTDLYYQSPANVGNPDLQPEDSWSAECGLRTAGEVGSVGVTSFIRHGTNLIDYVRQADDRPWQARNIAGATTEGVEIEGTLFPAALPIIERLNLAYTHLENSRSEDLEGYQSKYVEDHLARQLLVGVDLVWTGPLTQNIQLQHFQRVDGKEHTLVNTRVVWSIRDLALSLDVTNVFDIEYTEIGTIPMPGRWLRLGIRFEPDLGT